MNLPMNRPDLLDELDAWDAEGRCASLWLRDDDAAAPLPALDRLAGLAHEHVVAGGLAVVPTLVRPVIATWLESVRAEVLRHGWAHRSHAAADEKKSELGDGRDAVAVIAHLAARRSGSVDPTEPTGLPAHHAVHEESTWTFVARFMERTQ